MKIDSIDIRSFDAKQLTVDFEPPQTGVTVEMFDGALIPSESETYTPLSGRKVFERDSERNWGAEGRCAGRDFTNFNGQE